MQFTKWHSNCWFSSPENSHKQNICVTIYTLHLSFACHSISLSLLYVFRSTSFYLTTNLIIQSIFLCMRPINLKFSIYSIIVKMPFIAEHSQNRFNALLLVWPIGHPAYKILPSAVRKDFFCTLSIIITVTICRACHLRRSIDRSP